jgi:hypothetical protein
MINLESRPAAAFEWRPEPEAWSIREIILHLAIWDRFAASACAAMAEYRPLPPNPYPDGGLHAWNREQVAALSWMSLAEAVHEYGAAGGALAEQIRLLTPDQWEGKCSQGWRVERKHHLDHMKTIAERLRGSRSLMVTP